MDPTSRLAQSGAERRRLALEQVHSLGAAQGRLDLLDEARALRRRVDAPLAVEAVSDRCVRTPKHRSNAARADDGDARADFDAPESTSASCEWTRTFFGRREALDDPRPHARRDD